jgi:hypothetical protein
MICQGRPQTPERLRNASCRICLLDPIRQFGKNISLGEMRSAAQVSTTCDSGAEHCADPNAYWEQDVATCIGCESGRLIHASLRAATFHSKET